MWKGLQPQASTRLPCGERFRRWLDRRFERLVNAGAPLRDPFSESHLGWRRKLLRALLAIVPLAVAGIGILASTGVFKTRHAARVWVPPPAAHPAAEFLRPAPARDSELEVFQLVLERNGPPAVAGQVRNNSDAPFAAARISFNLLNEQGTVLGSVSAVVRDIPGRGTARFRVPVPHQGVSLVLVRETQRLP